MISPLHTLSYTGFIVAEVVLGAVRVARDVMTPGLDVSPAIVELPLRCETDLEISLMASSITITPGTLVLGIAAAEGERAPTMFVHSMFDDDRRSVVAGLAELEDKILLAVRKEGPR